MYTVTPDAISTSGQSIWRLFGMVGNDWVWCSRTSAPSTISLSSRLLEFMAHMFCTSGSLAYESTDLIQCKVKRK